MEKIKFLASDTIYDATISRAKANIYKITLNETVSEQILLSGFQILNEYNSQILGDFSDYTTKYMESNDKCCIYLSNGEVYNPEDNTGDDIIVDDYIPSEDELIELFEKTKLAKIAELSNICQEKIFLGVDVAGKHYSYTLQDQTNLSNAIKSAKDASIDVYYHADEESFSLYSYEELYGDSLFGIYLEKYNQIIKQNDEIMLALNSVEK